MKPLREAISNIVGDWIPESSDSWEITFKELNIAGRVDAKVLQQIIIELCKRVENLEHERADNL